MRLVYRKGMHCEVRPQTFLLTPSEIKLKPANRNQSQRRVGELIVKSSYDVHAPAIPP